MSGRCYRICRHQGAAVKMFDTDRLTGIFSHFIVFLLRFYLAYSNK